MVRAHARTLAQVSEEHIEEGDVDGAVGLPVVFDLAQHHLQPGHGEKGVQGGGRDMETRGGGKTSSSGTTSMPLAEQGQRAKSG